MSSPPGTLKSRNKLRQFLTQPFTRSRSRSPSQSDSPSRSPGSISHLNPWAPPLATGSNEDTGPNTSSSAGVSPAHIATTRTLVVESSDTATPTRADPVPGIPTIVEPTDGGSTVQKPDFGKKAVPHDDATDDDTALNPFRSFLFKPIWYRTRSTTRPVKPVNAIGSTQGQKDRSPSRDELRASLQVLKDTSKIFPPLGSAIESLLLCLDGFEPFSHNNRAVIMGCKDGAIKICTLPNLQQSPVQSFTAHSGEIVSIAESPDCSLLVSYSEQDKVLRVWSLLIPALELPSCVTSPSSSASGDSYSVLHEGWYISKGGWIVNAAKQLLFWVPPDINSAWWSPYATLVVTEAGTLQIPKQKPLVGDEWSKCYIYER